MVNIKKFPRGIEVVAKSGKSHANLESDQVISDGTATAPTKRAPGPGLKHQASSTKLQASSDKHQAFEPTCSIAKRQASQPE